MRVLWRKTYGHDIIKLISPSLSFISPLFSCVFCLLERGCLVCSQSSNALNICHQKVEFQTHFVRPKSRHLSMSRTTQGWDAFVHRHGATCCNLTFHTGLWNIHSDCEGIAGQRVPSFLKKRGFWAGSLDSLLNLKEKVDIAWAALTVLLFRVQNLKDCKGRFKKSEAIRKQVESSRVPPFPSTAG